MAIAKQPANKLTTMLFLKPYSRYAKGDRAGFPADKAKQMEDRKIAVPADQAAAAAASQPAVSKPVKGTEGADKV